MGTDIHYSFEKKNKDNRWEVIETDIHIYRNYLLFAVLANVRNRWTDLEYISEPRGLPDESAIWTQKNDQNEFLSEKVNREYSKKQFFEDLKKVKLDTIPGKKHKYSNLSLELTGLMLENIYQKDFQTLVK